MSYVQDVMDKCGIKFEDIPNILKNKEKVIKDNPKLEPFLPFLETHYAQETMFKRDPNYEEPRKLFEDFTDEEKIAYFNNVLTVFKCRKLEDGTWIGLHELMFKRSICVGLGYNQIYQYRWCFKDRARAEIEADKFKKIDDIPELGSFVAHRTATKPLVVKHPVNDTFEIVKDGDMIYATW